MNKLPEELIIKIFDYDGRYKEASKNMINELNTKISWHKFLTQTERESYMYYNSILDQKTLEELYYNSECFTFSKFFFNRFGKL
tara:strand:+ start:234 stop:485 length:252 start_codon:yes stop_codon:yes gene_type:complete